MQKAKGSQTHPVEQTHKPIHHQQALLKKQQEKEPSKQTKQVIANPKDSIEEDGRNKQVKACEGQQLNDEQIRKSITIINPNMNQIQIQDYIKYTRLTKKTVTRQNYQNWQKDRQQKIKQEEQSVKQSVKQKEQLKAKEMPTLKKQQEKAELSNLQLCQQFFTNYKPGENKQIRSKIIFALNSQIPSRLPVTYQTVLAYFKEKEKQHSLQQFKAWILKEEQASIEKLINSFKASQQAIAFASFQSKLKQIVTLIDDNKSLLNLHIGVGQTKGKTVLKYGAHLSESKESKFELSIDIKIKKKLELRTMIQNELKKIYKSSDYHLLKLCKIDFVQTDKALKIIVHSKVFEEFILRELISIIDEKGKGSNNTVFKVEGELNIKNSIKSDQSELVNKKFVKWIAEGATTRLHIEANHRIVQYFTSPLAEFFPVFKVAQAGQINLKLKSPQSVDKLFDKLGINQICEQTPSLASFISEINTEYLEMFPFVADILRRSIYFASNIPNEKIGIEVEGHVSNLQLNLTISTEACKQLGSIFSKSLLQQFS